MGHEIWTVQLIKGRTIIDEAHFATEELAVEFLKDYHLGNGQMILKMFKEIREVQVDNGAESEKFKAWLGA